MLLTAELWRGCDSRLSATRLPGVTAHGVRTPGWPKRQHEADHDRCYQEHGQVGVVAAIHGNIRLRYLVPSVPAVSARFISEAIRANQVARWPEGVDGDQRQQRYDAEVHERRGRRRIDEGDTPRTHPEQLLGDEVDPEHQRQVRQRQDGAEHREPEQHGRRRLPRDQVGQQPRRHDGDGGARSAAALRKSLRRSPARRWQTSDSPRRRRAWRERRR